MDINNAAPVVSRHKITIPSSVERVWDLLVDIDRWSEWNPAIAQSRLNGQLASGTTFTWKSGGVTITSTLQEVHPMSRISWTGKAIGTRAIHVWSLRPVEGGVLVATAESFEGWLVSLVRKPMQRNLDATLKTWLGELAKASA